MKRDRVESRIAALDERADQLLDSEASTGGKILTTREAQSMIGQTVGRYSIRSFLGAGAMGEVYLAKDVKLHREVAFKILRPHLSTRRDAYRRFILEARAVSKLNHPRICTVYEIGEQQNRPFIAMELLHGETLKERIRRGRLPLDKFLKFALQISDALQQTHSKGIVHRDIKPANIFIADDGNVKILDFGMVKLLPRTTVLKSTSSIASTIMETRTGTVMGTPSYMSPEQALGKRVDCRSDLFSVGILLYEMASGELPFRGPSLIAVLDSIINQQPVPLATHGVVLPSTLEAIVNKALRKDVDVRYQSALEMHGDLLKAQAGITSGIVQTRAKVLHTYSSIAVRPFVNANPNRSDDYFSDGLSNEITNALSRVEGLRVVSWRSASSFEGKNMDVRTLGKTLKVSAVVEGTVRRWRTVVRISVRIVDAETGVEIWAATFDRKRDDVTMLQEEIARQIAASLRVPLKDRSLRPATQRPRSLEAYTLYLQGRFHFGQRTPEGLKQSIRCFRAAVSQDPRYSLAYSGIADANMVLGEFGKAKAAALRAVRADDELAEGHCSLGLVRVYVDHDWKSSEREFKRALELNPAYATAHHWYALFLEHTGRFDEAIAEITRAHELEPFSLIIGAAVARIYLHAADLDNASKHALKTIELDPNFHAGHAVLGWIYRKQGRLQKALSEFEKAYQLSKGDFEHLTDIGTVHALAGRRVQATKILRKLHHAYSEGAISGYLIAGLYAALKENNKAFEWIDRVLQEKADVADLHVDTRFDNLRSDPRFQKVLLQVRPS